MRLCPTGHQPSISWSQGNYYFLVSGKLLLLLVVVVVLVLVLVLVLVVVGAAAAAAVGQLGRCNKRLSCLRLINKELSA